jgi:hypothetical protein
MSKFLQLVKRGVSTKPVRLVVYGPDGAGKTTLAAQSPRPIFLGTEDGFGLIDVPRFPEPRTWQQVLDSVDELTREEHDYRTIVLDTLDHLEPLVFAHVCAEKKATSIEEVGGGYGKGYLAALDEWRKLLARLDAARARGLTVVCLAHAQLKPFKNPEGPDYDRFSLKINEKAAALFREWCDAVLFLRFEDVVEKERRNDKKGKATGGQRVLYTERTPAFDAKNRFGMEPALVMERDTMWATIAPSFARSAEAPAPSQADLLRAELRALAAGSEGLARKVERSIETHGDNVAALENALTNLKNAISGQAA